MSMPAFLTRKGQSGFGRRTTAEEVTAGLDLRGKRYLVTGCASGLGLETTRVLSLRGAHVVAAARSEESARAALDSVGASGTPLACDLSEPSMVREAAAEVKRLGARLDGIICCAGVMALPTLALKHGIEHQFLINHLGHFILVNDLLDALTDDGRVVVVASVAHRMASRREIDFGDMDGERKYSRWYAYGRSKLANILFAKSLAKRFEGTRRTANAVHPGVINTGIGRHMGALGRGGMAAVSALLFKNIPQGAATQCYVAAHPDTAAISGRYFADCNVARPAPLAEDPDLADRLWRKSEELVGF